jgi:hypothetical protein
MRIDLFVFRHPGTTHEQMLPALILRRWKPTLVFDQTAQIFDLTGVAGVAVSTRGLQTRTVPFVPAVPIVPTV